MIAEVAKELGILTVAVVTKPFAHENKKRMNVALRGIDDLRERVDSLVLIPNEKLSLVLGSKITVLNCFKAANDVLQNAVAGISELITRPGHINVDFADVRSVMADAGSALMGVGNAGMWGPLATTATRDLPPRQAGAGAARTSQAIGTGAGVAPVGWSAG